MGLFGHFYSPLSFGWSGGAMVLGKLPVLGRPTIWVIVVVVVVVFLFYVHGKHLRSCRDGQLT